MNLRLSCIALAFVCLTLPLVAQTTNSTTTPATATVPRLITFSGTLGHAATEAGENGIVLTPGAAPTQVVAITFSLYAEQTGGAPLWSEMQNVQADSGGRYTVQLGATKPDGLPMDIFTSVQAQWLGVQPQGQAEQPRVLLVSVPYALKSGDAETFGGLPPSAYTLAPRSGTSLPTGSPTAVGNGSTQPNSPHPLPISGSGTPNYIPLWTNASNLASSVIYQDPMHGYIGIGTTSPLASLDVENDSFFPIIGSTTDGALPAISGLNLSTEGTAPGVTGTTSSPAGTGVYGSASSTSGAAFGVEGTTTTPGGAGVYGVVNGSGANGVAGVNQATTGSATGVFGSSASASGSGVVGSANGPSAKGGFFYNTATTGNAAGVVGQSDGGIGVLGMCGPSASPCTGVYAVSNSTSGTTNGLVAVTNSAAGAAGYFINNAGGLILLGVTSNGGNARFYVDGDGNGYFAGNLHVAGTLTKGGGSFKIDDPIDPANKYLSHSFVESPDMMNIYNGNVTTDKRGLATVVLPDYFATLNRDFRYQLTVIGQFAQAIIAKEINRGRFTIRTNKPGVKVSWQVTGIRQDAWANAHRIPTEEEKPLEKRGTYLYPELYGERGSEKTDAMLQH